jgi:hypothetical protein
MNKLKYLFQEKEEIKELEKRISNLEKNNKDEINKQQIDCNFTYGELMTIKDVIEFDCKRRNIPYEYSTYSYILDKINKIIF